MTHNPPLTTTPVELRLTGTAVLALADNAHIPGWPHNVDACLVRDDDPDADLHRAAARWYRATTRARVGKGLVYTAQVSAADAAAVLGYLDSLAGALCAPGVTDASARAEGRAIGRAVTRAAAHLRRRGFTVAEDGGTFEIREG
jgi:hypothetical protein